MIRINKICYASVSSNQVLKDGHVQTTKITSETVVFFADAKRGLPGSPSHQALQNATTIGQIGTDGKRHRLEWCKFPRGKATSVEAYRRFIDRLNGELARLEEDIRLDSKEGDRANA